MSVQQMELVEHHSLVCINRARHVLKTSGATGEVDRFVGLVAGAMLQVIAKSTIDHVTQKMLIAIHIAKRAFARDADISLHQHHPYTPTLDMIIPLALGVFREITK